MTATWHETPAPRASSRYDDIYFLDEAQGWAVNSNGQILHTTDGGRAWELQFQTPIVNRRPIYLRCIAFANERQGWAGTISPESRLYHSDDGGVGWTVVELPPEAPLKVCGLSVVDERVVYGSGSNDPADPARMMKTTDGGRTWSAWSMEAHAAALIDVHFFDASNGLVVGGRGSVATPRRDDLMPTVLFTDDGGATWEDRLAGMELPLGEWGWKIHFVNRMLGFVSLESFTAGAVLRTTDGGATWQRLPINDEQQNRNLEGVGFLNAQVGWVGGWGDMDFAGGFTSGTEDGGMTWHNANELGKFVNRFRFFEGREDVAYACGQTVYKMSAATEGLVEDVAAAAPGTLLLLSNEPIVRSGTVPFEYEVPEGAGEVWLHIWDRFGSFVTTVTHQERPAPGRRVDEWDGRDETGARVPDGTYLYRLTVDEQAESGVIALRA